MSMAEAGQLTTMPKVLAVAYGKLFRVSSSYFNEPTGANANSYEQQIREALKEIMEIKRRVYS